MYLNVETGIRRWQRFDIAEDDFDVVFAVVGIGISVLLTVAVFAFVSVLAIFEMLVFEVSIVFVYFRLADVRFFKRLLLKICKQI